MRKTIVLSLVWLVATVATSVAQTYPERIFTVQVQGEAVVMAVPDEAVVILSIQTEQFRNRSTAKSTLGQQATVLVEYLRSFGIPERKFKSTQRRVTPMYDHSSGKRKRTGYTGYQRFEVILPLDNADELLEGLPDVANEDSIGFRVSNARELRDGVVDKAIVDAIDRAEKREAEIKKRRPEFSLGPMLGWTESYLGRAQAQSEGGAQMMRMSQDAAAPQLPAGENEIRVNVTVTFRVEVPE